MKRRSLFGALAGVLLAPFAVFGKGEKDSGKLCGRRVEGVRIGRVTGAWGPIDAFEGESKEGPTEKYPIDEDVHWYHHAHFEGVEFLADQNRCRIELLRAEMDELKRRLEI